MAIIVSRITGSDGDLVLSLSNEQIARTMEIGSDWSRIRLGVRLAFSASASHLVLNPQLAIGLCSGTASLFGSLSTNNYVGIKLDGINHFGFSVDNTNGLSYFTSPDGNNVADSLQIATKVGTSSVAYTSNFIAYGATSGSASGSYGGPGSGSYSKWRTSILIDFLKPTTDPGLWQVILYGPIDQGTAFRGDFHFDTFYSNLTQLTSSLVFAAYNTVTANVPISESINGPLDTVNIYWNKSTPPLEISDVAVFRLN